MRSGRKVASSGDGAPNPTLRGARISGADVRQHMDVLLENLATEGALTKF